MNVVANHPILGFLLVMQIAHSKNLFLDTNPQGQKQKSFNILMILLGPLTFRQPKPQLEIDRIRIKRIKDILIMTGFWLPYKISPKIKTGWGYFLEQIVRFQLTVLELQKGLNGSLCIDLNKTIVWMRCPFLNVYNVLPVVWNCHLHFLLQLLELVVTAALNDFHV